MLHTDDIRAENPESSATPQDVSVLACARTMPRWAAILSLVFSGGAGLCLISVAVLAVFFQSLVAEQSQTLLAVLLGMVGVIPILGALLFDYAHIRALAGYRALREAHGRRAAAGLAVLVSVALGILHPLLCLGVVLAGIIALLGARLLARKPQVEPLWDITPEEAATLLAGRDAAGFRLTTTAPQDHAAEGSVLQAAQWAGILTALASASFLSGIGHLTTAAVPGVVLLTLWASGALAHYLLARTRPDAVPALTREVDHIPTGVSDMSPGLEIEGMSVVQPGGRTLLSEVNLKIEPGTIIGVSGPSGAGKSLLLRAIGGPYDLAGLDLRGCVRINGHDPWRRTATSTAVPVVYVPPAPLILPASGQDNLTCFNDGPAVDYGRQILGKLLFDSVEADRICDISDATQLPSGQQKALALARAFLLTPDVYLLDRPEDGLGAVVISALPLHLEQEKRMGRSVIMVTENRALLEACDQIIMLQDSRIVDFGDAREMRSKATTGWSGFTGPRRLESEDNLVAWVRNSFRRDGDDANRRNVAQVAAEMLSLSCQSASRATDKSVAFELKQFEGYCLLRMIDDDPALSSGKLELAHREAKTAKETGNLKRLSPLAQVLYYCEELEATVEHNRRVLTATIAIYDPRSAAKVASS